MTDSSRLTSIGNWVSSIDMGLNVLNSSVAHLWVQLGSTLGVLALIAAAAWVSVRFIKPKIAVRHQNARMQIVEKLPLESKQSLYLVRVDERELLVGVSENGVSLVQPLDPSLDQSLDQSLDPSSDPPEVPPGEESSDVGR